MNHCRSSLSLILSHDQNDLPWFVQFLQRIVYTHLREDHKLSSQKSFGKALTNISFLWRGVGIGVVPGSSSIFSQSPYEISTRSVNFTGACSCLLNIFSIWVLISSSVRSSASLFVHKTRIQVPTNAQSNAGLCVRHLYKNFGQGHSPKLLWTHTNNTCRSSETSLGKCTRGTSRAPCTAEFARVS